MRVVLLTGCNLGDKLQNMSLVTDLISQKIGRVLATSSIHYSQAWGFDSDDEFVNQVVVCDTQLTPEDMLFKIWEIEKTFGKERGSVEEEMMKYRQRESGVGGYVSRNMDIDILFYENQTIDTPLLKIPHPLIDQRDFVLAPLKEIFPRYKVRTDLEYIMQELAKFV